jgi:hypothetical protein
MNQLRDITMTYLDKTYCASPECKNECGRKMDVKDHSRKYGDDRICYGYFCGEPEYIPFVTAKEWADNWVEKNKDLLKRLADR